MNLKKLASQKQTPDKFITVVEIPKGSTIKYELDKETETIFVDRFAFTTMAYPLNYGFVPGTLADDGDPVDVLIMNETPVAPGTALYCRVIGMLKMEDEAGMDEKILAVPIKKADNLTAHIESLDDISEEMKSKIQHFFENYKGLEKGKWVKLSGWVDKKKAEAYLSSALEK